MDPIMTVLEVARYLKMSSSKPSYLLQRRETLDVKIGRNVRIKESDLAKWLEKHKDPATK